MNAELKKKLIDEGEKHIASCLKMHQYSRNGFGKLSDDCLKKPMGKITLC